MNRIIIYAILFLVACKPEVSQNPTVEKDNKTKVPIVSPERAEPKDTILFSLLGKPLMELDISEGLKGQLAEKEKIYNSDTTDLDNLIWYGRFLAYAGKYEEAINIYTKGMKLYPEEPRLYRHRGHRFITIRQFENAIEDLQTAKKLMINMPIQIEQDGMPNEKNIPVSSLQSNVLYHLGLAYYLAYRLPRCEKNFIECMNLHTNDDNFISSVYWLYMTLRRGGNMTRANSLIARVKTDMNIIENHTYHKICLFFQQSLSEYDLREFGKSQDQASQSAIEYALANWELFHNRPELAEQSFNSIIRGKDWNSFAFIAAESDLTRF